MITLTLGNSLCKVSGYSREQFGELRKLLSYREETGRWIKAPETNARGKKVLIRVRGKMVPKLRNVPEVITHHLIDKYGVFPTGLLSRVDDYFSSSNISAHLIDERIRPETRSKAAPSMILPGTMPKPYPEQIESAKAARACDRGIIVAPTALGKTLITALLCDEFQVKTLIVVPKVALKWQTIADLRKVFGERFVGPLINGEIGHLFTVENVDALDPAHKLKGLDMVIVDEFHHAAAQTYRKLDREAWSRVFFKFGLTATPFRSRSDEAMLLESVLDEVIYRVPYSVAVEKGYVAPVEFYYFNVPCPLDVTASKYAGVYKECYVENPYLNALLVHLTERLIDAGKSTLVLTKQIEHGLVLQSLMPHVPFAEGANELNSEIIRAFNEGELQAVLGTTGILGEGVNTRRCEYALLGAGGKAKTAFMQQVGRTLRMFPGKESGKVIMFHLNDGHWFSKHFKECLKICVEEYGVQPIELELPEFLAGAPQPKKLVRKSRLKSS